MAAFTPPPQAPQRGDRATFSSRMDAFLSWLVNLIPQLNAFVAGLNARDLGGANTFVYTFDAATADADPGPGKLRLDNTAQNAANVLRLDSLSGNGADVTAVLTALAAGTSNIKGSIRLQRVNDPSAWLMFDITGVSGTADAAAYRNLAVISRGGSSAAPFAAGDSVAVFLNRSGDKGDSGGTPTAQQIRDAVGTLPITSGGTGATTAAAARTNLGAMSAATAVVVMGENNNSSKTRLSSGNVPAIASASAQNWDLTPLTITNGDNQYASAVISFHRSGGGYAALFGLDTDNKWKVGGWSMGNNAYEIFHQGNFNPANYAPLAGAAFYGQISAPAIVNTSDETLKENWRALTDEQLDALAELELVGVFDWKDGSGSGVGGSAQKIREIVPQAVFAREDGTLGVDYGGLTFAMAHGALRRARRSA